MNFFKDLWNYLYDVYLRVDGSYENIAFEKTPLFSLRLTVLGIFIGTVAACIIMAYNKQVLGGAVRRIISREALSVEKALTIKELGYRGNAIIRNAFIASSTLRRFVKCAGEEEFIAEQNRLREEHEQRIAAGEKLPKFKEITYVVDPATDRFYSPEDLRIRAEVRFEKKGSGWVSTVLTILFLCVAFFIILLVLPMVFGVVDNFLGAIK